jgi:phosphoribosylformimino-5-aminoimidazole carboxamide ribotide isomerase
LSVTQRDLTLSFLERFGPDKIILALDVRMQDKVPLLAIKGWLETTPLSLWELLKWYPSQVQILCTDISKDGMEKGPSFELYRELLARHGGGLIQASGGITTLDDLLDLKNLGLGSAVVGKAIYQGRFKVSEGIECLK